MPNFPLLGEPRKRSVLDWLAGGCVLIGLYLLIFTSDPHNVSLIPMVAAFVLWGVDGFNKKRDANAEAPRLDK